MKRMFFSRSKKIIVYHKALIAFTFIVCALYIFKTQPFNSDLWFSQWLWSTKEFSLLYKILSIVFLAINSFLLTRLTKRLDLKEKRTSVSVFYLLLCFSLPFLLQFENQLLIFIFIAGVLFNLFSCFEQGQDEDKHASCAMQSGFWCGVLFLMYPQMCILLIAVYAMLILQRAVNLRLIVLPIVGMLISIVYSLAIMYLVDAHKVCEIFIQNPLATFLINPVDFQFTPVLLISIIVLGGLTIFSLFGLIRARDVGNFYIRKKYAMLIFITILLIIWGNISLKIGIFQGLMVATLSLNLAVIFRNIRPQWMFFEIFILSIAAFVNFLL